MSKTEDSTDARPGLERVPQARVPPETVTKRVTADANGNELVEVESEDGSVAAVVFVGEDAGQAAAGDVIQSLQDAAIPIAARRES